MNFPLENDFYIRSVRSKIISKHNVLNLSDLEPCGKVNVIFALKKTNRECNLLLFWLSFVLVGKRPLILRTFTGYKKKKIKFIVSLNLRHLMPFLKTFSVFILSNHRKNKTFKLKKETSGFFFYFSGSFLEYVETFKFYDFVTAQELSFLLENLFIVFKFFCYKKNNIIKTLLNLNQVPATF
jgi:hypothetical protein